MKDIEDHDETRARRIAVRVPDYTNEQDRQRDDDTLKYIIERIATASENAIRDGGISHMEYDKLQRDIERARANMVFPDLDVYSGEPLSMLSEKIIT